MYDFHLKVVPENCLLKRNRFFITYAGAFRVSIGPSLPKLILFVALSWNYAELCGFVDLTDSYVTKSFTLKY
jgi:hypothetical protein